jgi:hypothetical protein
MLTGAPAVELFECNEDHLTNELSTLASLNPNSFSDAAEETLNVSTETCLIVGVTADQSCALHTLSLLSTISKDNAFHAMSI